MTAIDLATRLANRLLKAPVSLAESSVLFAVASGLDTVTDISHVLDHPRPAIHNAVHSLTKADYLRPSGWTDDGTPTYALTRKGKNLLQDHYFPFLQKH